MRDVARAAGVSVAGLYYYLPSKQTALYLICDRIFDRLDALMPVRTDGNAAVRLRGFIRGHLDYVIRNRDGYRVLLRDMEALQNEYRHKLHARRRRYFETACDLVRQVGAGNMRIPARLATAALFGMLNWTPTWYQGELDGRVDDLAGDMYALFMQGIFAASIPLKEAG